MDNHLQKQIVAGRYIKMLEESQRALIDNAKEWDRGLTDDQIREIMLRTSAAYFAGQYDAKTGNSDLLKRAQEVAKLI